MILLVVFGASAWLGIAHKSPELLGVAGAAAGAVIRLLAPPPTTAKTE